MNNEVKLFEAKCEETLRLIDEKQEQEKKLNKEFESANSQLDEVKLLMKQFEIEKEKIESEKAKIDSEINEFKSRSRDLNEQITKKFKNLKVWLKEFHQFYELDLIERNLDNDDYIDENEAQNKDDAVMNEQNEENKGINTQVDMDVDKVSQNKDNQSENSDEEYSQVSYKSKRAKLHWSRFMMDNTKIDDFKLKQAESEGLADDIDEISQELKDTEEEIEKLNPNMGVIEDFKKLIHSFKTSNKILQKFKENEKLLKDKLAEVNKKKYDKFMTGFNIIKAKLKEMYRFITGEGDAELDLKDSLDPFIEGVVFTVRPPKKSWKQISHLSGGEKTLASLSLIFALHHFKPTPIYCMDEIDAALDYKNVSIVASYVKQQAWNAQFIVISLRQNMFEMSDKMVGIYKIKDVTRTVTIAPRRFEEMIMDEIRQSSIEISQNP